MRAARKAAESVPGHPVYVNQHCAYTDLSRSDRHALRDVLKSAFPIGGSSHALWREFPDTTAFLRRIAGDVEGPPARGVVGGAIVMSHTEDQYDYLAYFAIHPDHRFRRTLFARGSQPHHGTDLLHHVYDVMRSRVSPTRLQRYLMIEPAGSDALRFYLRALPAHEYPVKLHEADTIISVGYDGLVL